MTRYQQAIPQANVLIRDDEALALVDTHLYRLGPVGVRIWTVCETARTRAELTKELGSYFGPPPVGSLASAADNAITELVSHGIIEPEQ